MFSTLVSALYKDVEQIKCVVHWQDKVRNTLYPPPAGTPPVSLSPMDIATLQVDLPSRLSWQNFDHCATVSQVYAVFEESICDLVTQYLAFIPRIQPTYGLLPYQLRSQHRMGVGQILTKWNSASIHYRHLAESDVAMGLADGLRAKPYQLLADAFLVDSENFRSSAIRKIFSYLDVVDCFAWVRDDPRMSAFCLSLGQTTESFLDDLVGARNEAAHGKVTRLFSPNMLVQYADFVALLVDVLSSLLRTRLLKNGITTGVSELVGEVIHIFSGNVVGITASANSTIIIGDKLYAGKKHINPISIVTLRIVDANHQALALSPGMTFGAGLDRKLPVGAKVYRWTV